MNPCYLTIIVKDRQDCSQWRNNNLSVSSGNVGKEFFRVFVQIVINNSRDKALLPCSRTKGELNNVDIKITITGREKYCLMTSICSSMNKKYLKSPLICMPYNQLTGEN